MLLAASCTAEGEVADAPGACAVAEDARSIERSEPSPADDLLQWAGFEAVESLDVVGSEERCGLDAYAAVALEGDPADVDAAIEAAGFTAQPTPGLSVTQDPVDAASLDDLAGVVSSDQESFQNSAGETLVRMYVRGGLPDGRELLHVWAFTT